MTASDTVTANPFANPLIPALGKTMRPVASMATPATTATNWKRVEVIFSSSYAPLNNATHNNRQQIAALGQKAKFRGDQSMSAFAKSGHLLFYEYTA
jgi:hypothetical protein